MANIQNELNNIKNAVFGKDVRDSIHDAIKTCYDDASIVNDNANMEVKMARGVHNTLGDRLNKSDEKQEEISSQLEQNITNFEEQFNAIERKQFITPEDFQGDDTEKIQKSVDYAIENDIDICINKTYLINKTITINKTSEKRVKTSIFGGGRLILNFNGFIFKGLNKSISDLYFNNISFDNNNFNGGVFECGNGKLIRLMINNCHFKNLDFIFYTDYYLQSIRVINSTFIGIKKAIIECGGLYDVRFTNNVFEHSIGQLINHTSKGEHFACTTLSIKDNVIEGIENTKPIIYVCNPNNIVISSNYFEANKSQNIEFYNSYECVCVDVSKNNHLGKSNSNEAFVKWSGILKECKTSSNSISGLSVNNTLNVVEGQLISSCDFSTALVKNIIKDETDIVVSDNNFKSDNVMRVGKTHYTCSKALTNVVNEELVARIKSPIHAGFNVKIIGGGVQGDVGCFSLECNYKVTKYNYNYSINNIESNCYGSTSQYNGIICKEDDGDICLYVKSINSLSSSYDLTIYIDGSILDVIV